MSTAKELNISAHDLLPPDLRGRIRFLKRDVRRITGMSNATLSRRLKAGEFPKPQKDGNLCYWLRPVIEQYIDDVIIGGAQ